MARETNIILCCIIFLLSRFHYGASYGDYKRFNEVFSDKFISLY